MSESPAGKARRRGGRVVALFVGWASKRERARARLERLLLPVAVAIFVAATVIAVRNLPPLRGPVRWPLLLVAALIGIPATLVLNAKEYQVSARMVGHRVPLSASMVVGLIAAAANQLPIPGSVLVRVRALGRLGTTYSRAAFSTALMGLLWIAATGLVAGAFQVPTGRWELGVALLGAGGLVLGLSILLFRSRVGGPRRVGVLIEGLAVEGGLVLVAGFRYYLVLRGLGFEASPSQAMVLTLAIVIAAMAGFLPGGLGLREVLAAGFSPVAGLPASVGLLATAIDRVMGLVVLGLASLIVLARSRSSGVPGGPRATSGVQVIDEAREGPPAGRQRLLVLTTTLPARPGDGTPEFVLSLSRALSQEFEVTILAPRVRGGTRLENVNGVTIHRFPYFPRRLEGLADGAILPNLKSQPWRWIEAPFLVTSFVWHAYRVARRERPDVVHAHWILPGGMVAAILKRRMQIPYVLTVHGADAYALRGRVLRWLKRWVLNGASDVSPVSRDIAAAIESPEPAPVRPVVPMGVDVEAIRNTVGDRVPERGRFVFVGRLAEKKGLDVLIRSLARVPDITLQVIGDGPDRVMAEALADELGVRERVRFAGRLPSSAVMDELRRAFALVIPSKVARGGDQEGTPVVLGEAMAAGVPVIASRLGGLAEHVEEGVTGLLVEPGSVDSLAQALRMAVSDPETLQAFAQRASRHAVVELNIRYTRDRYLELIRRAAADRHPGRAPAGK
ncbi:MAG: glycosyltransferase [Actinomycetota bacterium]